jgi:hypothetical protein
MSHTIDNNNNETPEPKELRLKRAETFSQTEKISQNLIKDISNVKFPITANLKAKNHDFYENIINEVNFELKSALSNIVLSSDLLETTSKSIEDQTLVYIIQRNSKRISDLIIILNSALQKQR